MKEVALIIAAFMTPIASHAGCIGPTIMGECKGQIVQFDTHPQGPSGTPPPPPGMVYDKRGTGAEQSNPGSVNPFTGQDVHDPVLNTDSQNRCRKNSIYSGGLNCQ